MIMYRKQWMALGLFLVAAMLGCGSSGGGANMESTAGDGGGAAADAGLSLDPSLVTDPEVASIVTLTMDTFTVPPGAEVFKCQDFANPFAGVQADLKAYELHMSTGSHHMFAFYKSGATDGALIDCPQGGLEFGPFTFTSQSPHLVETFPEGVGATIPTTMGFHLNAHYINVGSTPIEGKVQITMYVAKSGIVTQHAGVLYASQNGIKIPPTGQPVTSSATCNLPQDVNVLSSASHMHQRATDFVATSGGVLLYQSNDWDSPVPAVFSPPRLLKSGADLTWTCTYVNDTGSWLTFGESAKTNVMCISVSIFYPVTDVSNPVIQCQE
jgi:hypothetical protein